MGNLGSFKSISPVLGAFPAVYRAGGNVFSDAALAFSLEDLGLGNITKPINVRRSTDNVEQEFTYAEITDGSLTTFCGAGDGFVVNYYDQSNSANHAFNTTAAEQPKIVNAGALILENGKPIVDGSGGKRLQLTTGITGANYWIFEVGRSAYTSVFLGTIVDDGNYAYASKKGDPSGVINQFCTGLANYINGILTPFADRADVYTAVSPYHLAAHNIDLTPGSFNLLGYFDTDFTMRSSQALVIYSSDPAAGREAVEAELKSRYNTP